MITQCIITGCALYLKTRDYVWGDLHLQGDRFIFNAVVDRDGAMKSGFKIDDNTRVVTLQPDEDCFMRRGIVVFRASRAVLNKAAQAHIDEWGPELND